MFRVRSLILATVAAALLLSTGCWSGGTLRKAESPTKAGLNVKDLIDIPTQMEADELSRMNDFVKVAGELQQRQRAEFAAENVGKPSRPPRHVLCLSGGGSFGAFSAGVLCGWTQSGTRPDFDVVTGISTGSLLAPFAFLGPKYDAQMKRFFTTVHKRDIYRLQLLTFLWKPSFATNAPMGKLMEEIVTPEMISEIAVEHTRGRRLYIGSTELEGKRFIVWDIGGIACRGKGESDRKLILQILLGSSAIPGFFPPSEIEVNVDGKAYTEKHGDGGVSQAIFFRPPFVPPEHRANLKAHNLADVHIWNIVAGKLYADPEVQKPKALDLAGTSVSTIIYAQTRGDLQRIFLMSLLSGMDYNLTSIPVEFDAPKSATDFNPEPMTKMFNEGVRLSCSGNAWRKLPPGALPGETIQERAGTCLINLPQGAAQSPASGGGSILPLASGPLPIPSLPGNTGK
ncbi:hypothetical protein BH11PLA2_BH11PLA2_04860 [soil metagenome]